MTTKDNLESAFSGESQANRKYTAFAIKAEQEGFPEVARLFRAAAEGEAVHAAAHLRTLGGIGSTAENLQTAIDGEDMEFKDMYPKFIEQAKAEKNGPAANTFKNAMPSSRCIIPRTWKPSRPCRPAKTFPRQSVLCAASVVISCSTMLPKSAPSATSDLTSISR